MTDDLNLFDDERTVEPSRSSTVRVLLALLGVGVLIAGAVIVVAALVTSITPKAPSSTELTLTDVEHLTALDFPDGAKLTSSAYSETPSLITVDATVRLPGSAANPFADTAYFAVDEPGFDWPADDLTDVSYFAASGESGTLNAAGLFATTADSDRVVFVHLTRELG